MYKKLLLGLLITSAFFLIGCAAFNPEPKLLERHGVNLISYPDDQKVVYVKENGHADLVCAARGTDVFGTASEGVNLSAGVKGTSESIGGGESEGGLALGGRSPEVLITRELMYRACEFTMNQNLSLEDAIRVYTMFLETLAKVTDTVSGTTPSNAPAPPVPDDGG